jgi:hypothetical protein
MDPLQRTWIWWRGFALLPLWIFLLACELRWKKRRGRA